MISKPTYEDLASLLRKISKETSVESALGIEWANYPIETFDELLETIMDLELPTDQSEKDRLPD